MYISTPKNSSILAWEIPWTENPGRLQFMGWQRGRHDWVTTQLAHWGIELLKKTTFTPFLPVFYKVIEKKKNPQRLYSEQLYAYTHTYWRRQWHRTPVLLPGKSHGRRSLVGYSPWGHEESDMTERLHFPFSLSCIGEGIVTHSSVLAWRIPGTGSLVGCRLWGRTRLTWLSSSKFAFT